VILDGPSRLLVCILLALTKAGISGVLLRSSQPQKGREGGGNTEERHRDLIRPCTSRVASQTCFPGEAGVSPLCARKDHIGGGKHRGNRPSKTDLDSLLTHKLETDASVFVSDSNRAKAVARGQLEADGGAD